MLKKYDIFINDRLIKKEEDFLDKSLITNKDKILKIEKVEHVGSENFFLIIKGSFKPLNLNIDTQKGIRNLEFVEKTQEEKNNDLKHDAEEITTNKEIIRKQKKRILDYLKEREVTSLYHFTAFVNVPSICKRGLITRDKVEKLSVKWINDWKRLDGTDGISLSISFPNYKMFYRFRDNKRNMKWVLFELDPRLILDNDCLFLYTNASNKVFRNGIDYYRNLENVKKMFAKTLYYDSKGSKERSNKIPSWFTTDPQAEILALDDIPTKFIKRILFESDEDRRALYYPANYNLVLAPELFNRRDDYLNWQSGREE